MKPNKQILVAFIMLVVTVAIVKGFGRAVNEVEAYINAPTIQALERIMKTEPVITDGQAVYYEREVLTPEQHADQEFRESLRYPSELPTKSRHLQMKIIGG